MAAAFRYAESVCGIHARLWQTGASRPDEREAARLEQAVDAARKAKDARALAEAAARLDAYWQSKLDSLVWLPWSHGWFHGGL